MSHLEQLASLLARRNAIDEEIAALIDRPAIKGHVGEWIAQEIFKVTANQAFANHPSDGVPFLLEARGQSLPPPTGPDQRDIYAISSQTQTPGAQPNAAAAAPESC